MSPPKGGRGEPLCCLLHTVFIAQVFDGIVEFSKHLGCRIQSPTACALCTVLDPFNHHFRLLNLTLQQVDLVLLLTQHHPSVSLGILVTQNLLLHFRLCGGVGEERHDYDRLDGGDGCDLNVLLHFGFLYGRSGGAAPWLTPPTLFSPFP